MNVFVAFVSRHGDDKVRSSPAVRSVLSYSNVFFNKLDLVEFSRETPLQEFIRSGKLQNAKFVVSHTSDVLRLLMLWKYGGTYLDGDMIVQKPLDSVLPNYACDETCNALNGAILNLDQSESGHGLAEIFMKDLAARFNGSDWGCNGPMLFTRVLQKLCKTNETQKMIEMKTCEGFHVLPSNFCYAIPGLSWEKFFNETFADDVLKLTNESLVVHLWNNMSKKSLLRVNSTAAYVQLAKRYCPKVMASCGEFF